MKTIDKIEEILKIFKPYRLQVVDDSHKHKGHPEALKSTGGHYTITIVSKIFEGKKKIIKHRMIYEALRDLIPEEIHALSINCFSIEEYERKEDSQIL